MFSWAKNAVGLTEPVYGSSAVQSVSSQLLPTNAQWTSLQKPSLAWEVMSGTNVETKTFYMTSSTGKLGLVQVIYSDVLGIRTTAQFNCKIIDAATATPELWCSDNLDNVKFSANKQGFSATGVSMEISEDGSSYRIKGSVNRACIVDITFKRSTEGFVAGKDGITSFGTDPVKPWGRMYHKFWPRCEVSGSFITQKGEVDFGGKGAFIHCLQGMKPHFAAARWNFATFHSPSYSANLMEFTTPPSYGESVIAVGGITSASEVLIAGPQPAVVHNTTAPDSDNEWPEPKNTTFSWKGLDKEGKEVKATLGGDIGKRMDRVDVMGEMPKFVKNIVAGVANTKPYIYQYCPKMTLKLEVDGKVIEEEGQLFMEATFIS
nr:hypothetical protein B0A51_11453 [Rachicladosporium sp. CCFEE 5018]